MILTCAWGARTSSSCNLPLKSEDKRGCAACAILPRPETVGLPRMLLKDWLGQLEWLIAYSSHELGRESTAPGNTKTSAGSIVTHIVSASRAEPSTRATASVDPNRIRTI